MKKPTRLGLDLVSWRSIRALIMSAAVSMAIPVVVMLTGCVRFQQRPLSAAKTAANFEGRSLVDSGLRDFMKINLKDSLAIWPLPEWDLAGLTLAAFYFHPDLDVARAQWAVANGGKITAAERPNPTLNVTPGYNTTTSTPTPWIPAAILDVPLETAGKRGHRRAQAARLSEAARLNIASVAWQVRSRVRSRLVGLYAAQETQVLLQDQQTLQTENLRLLERQYEAGAVSAYELTQARIAAEGTRFALRDAQRRNAEARVQLAEAIGVPAGSLDSIRYSFDGLGRLPGEALPAEVRRQAQLNRSDILSALAEYAASESALQLEIAKQYPDLHFTPGYQYDQGEDKWSLGLTLTLPVLNRNRGAIAEAQARCAESAARFNALQARVLAAIDLAVAGYRVARQKQADANGLLDDLQRQEKTARAIFDIGEISRSELIGVRLQLSVTALARLEALVESQQVLGALEDALQSPLGLPTTVWQTSPRESESRGGNAHP
ncbi:MAG: TolC family protein [Candidatus Glassbacteria bacterium]